MVFDAFAGREKASASTSSLPGSNVTDALVALRAKCENIEKSRHWDYHRPLTSSKGLVYRNKFCAQCHGERKDNLIEWSMKVECNANQLLVAKSASDAYFLALDDLRCDISYVTDNIDVIRDCEISSCYLMQPDWPTASF
ncbi:hypothetical protein V1264_012018 [Littorina saxatilis]|uniref:Uncharacterized protein n=1 Tax=Littorina saxatilis TaxID=31220 RepID=A0AAN9BVD1_9CAEN